jgi:hypothetical protein
MIAKLTERFAGWTFDEVDTWTAPFHVKLRLSETAEFASVINTHGKSTSYPTSNLDDLHYRAVAAD